MSASRSEQKKELTIQCPDTGQTPIPANSLETQQPGSRRSARPARLGVLLRRGGSSTIWAPRKWVLSSCKAVTRLPALVIENCQLAGWSLAGIEDGGRQ